MIQNNLDPEVAERPDHAPGGSREVLLEVVDVGCGTGALGALLGELRPDWELDGVDISELADIFTRFTTAASSQRRAES